MGTYINICHILLLFIYLYIPTPTHTFESEILKSEKPLKPKQIFQSDIVTYEINNSSRLCCEDESRMNQIL
jgi:hypothetical protein